MQIQAFEAAAINAGFSPNNRPIQSLNGRQFNELNYEIDLPAGATVTRNFGVVPEPTSFVMVFMALGGLCHRWRKFSRA